MPIFDPDDPFSEAPPREPFKGIDFRLLNTPEAREAAKQRRLELEAKLAAKEASQKRMAEYLLRNVEEDEINNAWEREFIRSVSGRLNGGLTLTAKQDEILTRLFEKY